MHVTICNYHESKIQTIPCQKGLIRGAQITMKGGTIVTALALLGGMHIASAQDNQCSTPLQAVQSRATFNRAEQLVNSTGLSSDLETRNAEWTLFLPTKRAFDKFFIQLDLPPDAALSDKAFATAILYNHVAFGAFRSQDLGEGRQLDLVFSNNKTIIATNSAVTAIDGERMQASYVEADIQTCRSYVHAIDNVVFAGSGAGGVASAQQEISQPPFPDDLNLNDYGKCIGDATDLSDPCASECFACRILAQRGANQFTLRVICGRCRDCSADNGKYARHGRCQFTNRG